MKKKIFICMVFIFLVFFISISWAQVATDKTPSINSWGESTPPADDTSTAFFQFWNEHIDFQTGGKSWYYPHATRNQRIGSYENCWHDYIDGGYYNDIRSYFNSIGVHRDSAFSHYVENTYQSIGGVGLFVPGWNPSSNDQNNDWVRDWDADYDYDANFSVDYTDDYIEDAGGGQQGSWTTNMWQNDYVKLGWGGNGDTVSFTVASNTTSRIYVDGEIPTHSYTWFIVDDASASDHNAVAMVDSVAHIILYSTTPGYQRVPFNVLDSRVQAWAGKNQATTARSIKSQYPYPGLREDNIFKHYPWGKQIIVMGGQSLENFEDYWITGFRDFLSEIKDSCGEDVLVYGNITNYLEVVMDTLIGNLGGTGPALDGFWMEFGLRATHSRSNWNAYKNTIERRKGVAKYQFLHGKYEFVEGDTSRAILVDLAQYYLVRDLTDSIYFLYDTDPQYGVGFGDTTRWWRGIMSVNMGLPIDTSSEVYESGVYIWKRPFENGLVIYKPRPGDGSNYTDSTLHSLGGYYYRLDIDGNINPPNSISSLYIKNAEGVILLNSGEAQSQLYPPQPLFPQNDATVDTSQLILVVRNTQDSAGRPLIYEFQLDSVEQFNSEFKKQSSPLELGIGEGDTTFWPIPNKSDLSVGKDYYWKCRAYVALDPSVKSDFFDPPYKFSISDPSVDSSDTNTSDKINGSIHVFPNPFKPSKGDSFITFRNIPLYSRITITTLSGELVRELSNNTTTDVIWDVKNRGGKDLSSGTYFYRVDFSSGSSTGKLTVIR